MSPAELELRDAVDVLRAQVSALNDERRLLRDQVAALEDRVTQLDVVLGAAIKGAQEATVLALRLHSAAPPRPRS